LDPWGRLLERGVDEEPSRNKIAKEAAQRSMFPFPEAGRKASVAAKLPTVLRCDRLEGNIAQGTVEGAQDSGIYGKHRT
jgi:hypothetical protein